MRNFDYKYYAELIPTFNKTQPLIGNNKILLIWFLYCLKDILYISNTITTHSIRRQRHLLCETMCSYVLYII